MKYNLNTYLNTMQDNISLGDGRFDLSESWFTIIAFIVFPILMIIVYLVLKKAQKNKE